MHACMGLHLQDGSVSASDCTKGVRFVSAASSCSLAQLRGALSAGMEARHRALPREPAQASSLCPFRFPLSEQLKRPRWVQAEGPQGCGGGG